MKVKRRLRTREELLALEEKYPCVLGNPLSLGASHFRQANRRNSQPPACKGNGPFPPRTRKLVAA